MRSLFSNVRRLFTNVRSLLSSVKCLLILFPGLGNSENSLPVQEKCPLARIYSCLILFLCVLYVPSAPQWRLFFMDRWDRWDTCFWLKTTTTHAREEVKQNVVWTDEVSGFVTIWQKL